MKNNANQVATAVHSLRWVGPNEGTEFGPCYQLAADSAAIVDDLEQAADLTVFACPRPTVEVASLAEAAGQGECVQLLGTWCEGEGRTGRVAEGVERVFWHAWPSWWRGRTEKESMPGFGGPVWVQTPDGALAASLIDALADESIGATWAPAERLLLGSPAVVLWDGAQLSGREASRLAGVCGSARKTPTPVVAMLDFPRPETVAAAEAIGAAAVLGKPFERALLLETLRYAVAASRHGVTAADPPARQPNRSTSEWAA